MCDDFGGESLMIFKMQGGWDIFYHVAHVWQRVLYYFLVCVFLFSIYVIYSRFFFYIFLYRVIILLFYWYKMLLLGIKKTWSTILKWEICNSTPL